MFYDKFVQLCDARGVSPSRAAVEAGLSKSTVSKWKSTPDAEPTGAAIKKLTQYFGISIAELMGDAVEKTSTKSNQQPPSKDILDEVDIAFYDGYKELSEDDKETVRDMVRVMRERRAKKQEK